MKCEKCGKEIKGSSVVDVPPNYLIQLGLDRVKAWHPNCKLIDMRKKK